MKRRAVQQYGSDGQPVYIVRTRSGRRYYLTGKPSELRQMCNDEALPLDPSDPLSETDTVVSVRRYKRVPHGEAKRHA